MRQYGRTATEARVRSPSEVSAFRAETERWSGIRTRDRMIHIHLLYQTELSFVAQETGIEPATFGSPRRSAAELLSRLHLAEHETARPARASRDHNEPEPMAKAKERVNKRSTLQLQER